MDKIASYIQDLLFEREALTVPELGTFYTHYQPAEISNVSQSKPPQHGVSFVDNPRNNDGVLASFVATQMQVNEEEAMAFIKDFVDRVRHEIRYNKLYEFKNVGVFSLTKDRRLAFASTGDTNFLGESFGMNELPTIPTYTPPIQEEVTPSNYPIVEEPMIDDPHLGEEEMPENEEINIPPVYEEVTEKYTIPEVPIETVNEQEENVPIPEPIYESASIEDTSTITEPTTELEPTLEYEVTPKKNNGWAIAGGLAATALLVIGGLHFYDKSILGLDKYYDKWIAQKDTIVQTTVPIDTMGFESLNSTKPDTMSEFLAKVDSVKQTVSPQIEPSSTKLESKTEPKKKVEVAEKSVENKTLTDVTNSQETTISPDGNRYYVIAGGFSNETNANVFKKQLQKAGYTDIKFLAPQGDEKLIKVSAADFANGGDAFAKAKELSENFKGVWVLTPKKK